MRLYKKQWILINNMLRLSKSVMNVFFFSVKSRIIDVGQL